LTCILFYDIMLSRDGLGRFFYKKEGEMNRMAKTCFLTGGMIWLVTIIGVLMISMCANAGEEPNPTTPSVSVAMAEGMIIVFKDGATSPGEVSTRLHLSLGWKLPNNFGVSALIGFKTPNDTFRPAPRAGIGVSYALTDRVGVSTSVVYQFNYWYNNTPHSHFIGGGLGTSVKIGNGLSLALVVGPGTTLGTGIWTLLFQPGVSYAF